MPLHMLLAFSISLALFTSTTTAPSAPSSDHGGKKNDKLMSAETFSGLQFRSLGPALMSGRIADFAVDPRNRAHYFVAVASGGVWKSDNSGATWTPVFDGQDSYSIGCLALDPANPSVVWVGTGENNSQRSVGFGDGVYRTRDGGAHWENLGLKESEHIGKIIIDPRDSNVVYAAAQGPLWKSGGERGLYKSVDGGANWKRVLFISDDTGVNEVHFDPANPDALYASAYQRRRHVWTLINGGPESALYKSTDAGRTWRKITNGLPEVDMGRIGLAVSPGDPQVVYAIIEAADDKGGFFRSTDRGENWVKQSDYMTSSPQYYNEIVCDPKNVDRVYALDTFLQVTHDAGKTFKRVGGENRHVDDHALWIDPADTDYLLVGGDGGIYESFDRGAHWTHKTNLPITQFYRVCVDNSLPFYFVYGGTQDNNTLGGPSRTKSPAGIANDDWFVTVGGDGFEPQVDPEDPNIVYSQWQYGGLIRFDRKSGEIVDIKPRETPDDAPNRWNWDSPLLVSPHDHKRLYFASQRLYRSDDRGDSWTAITGDLSRGLDRDKLKVMGRLQLADAVAKHNSTSIYGNCVALAESPLVGGLIYVGTDDGLVHVSEDDGRSWRKESAFPAIPDVTYVSSLTASRHDENTVFASFDNHKNGDFKPYLLRSPDRGQTWESIVGDLPERQIVYCLAEDHAKPGLLFAGTEFGVFFTLDGGARWVKLKGGLPTIAVRDMAIQSRECDLVLATFGRGFYVLDDYSPLRQVDEDELGHEALLFPVKNALRYVETSRFSGRTGRGWMGTAYYTAPNPPFGAVFTYYLKEKLMTRRERRKEAEKKAGEAGETPDYPSMDELRAEDEEKEPSIILTVSDDSGNVVRRLSGPRDKGFHRVAWDLRFPTTEPIVLKAPEDRPDWALDPVGHLAVPGAYTVSLAKEIDGVVTPLCEPKPFDVVPLELAAFAAEDRAEAEAFQAKVSRLHRAVQGALKVAGEARDRIAHLRKAVIMTPNADAAVLEEIAGLDGRLNRLLSALRGDETLAKRQEPLPPSIAERVETVLYGQLFTTSSPTKTQRDAYGYAGEAFTKALADLRELIEDDLAELERKLEAAGAPWTPGRIPNWQME